MIGIRAVLDKKNEKNYTFFIKYTMKETIKNEKKDPHNSKSVFYSMIVIYLIEKYNIYFIGNSDEDKFILIQR